MWALFYTKNRIRIFNFGSRAERSYSDLYAFTMPLALPNRKLSKDSQTAIKKLIASGVQFRYNQGNNVRLKRQKSKLRNIYPPFLKRPVHGSSCLKNFPTAYISSGAIGKYLLWFGRGGILCQYMTISVEP